MWQNRIPDYADHMTIEEMYSGIMCTCFTDYDGFGYYSTEDKESDIEFKPSNFNPPAWATHVTWYNK